MIDVLPYLPETTIITFIPTATTRRRQRGYDQSELLARAIARSVGCRLVPLLGRNGQNRQVGARRQQRLSQLQDAFYPRHSSSIQGASILLVDDILTTGATLETAGRALKKAGAKEINAVVFAQKSL